MKLIMVPNKLKGASRIRKNIESQGKGGEGLERKKREESPAEANMSSGLNYYHYCNDSVMFSFLNQ